MVERPLGGGPGEVGDCFNSAEVEATTNPTPRTWKPPGQYADVQISKLVPGPAPVCLLGRLVNFYDQPTPERMPPTAKGCLKLLMKDDTGTMMIRLWYAEVHYDLLLGQLVSLWTSHISPLTEHGASHITTIFPERDNSCNFMVLADKDRDMLFKKPLGYTTGKQLTGLTNLRALINGGHEIADCRVIVCVKSIGGRKKTTTKQGISLDMVLLNIFDDTSEATLSLCSRVAKSAAAWKTSHTVLLLSNPGFRANKRPTFYVNANTHVDIDPCMTDTEWLRAFAQSLTSREAVNTPFPEGVFDIAAAVSADDRVLFNLSEIDEYIREDPSEVFMGYLSVLILEMNLMTMHQRSRMFCAECCGVPVYANTTSTRCKQCDAEVSLGINPRLVGAVIDETGSIGSGKLVFSTEAWENLLGRTAPELAQADSFLLKSLETRLLFLRLTFLFGWSEKIKRLCICRVLSH